VGLELWFYLLVPFLVQWRTIFVVGVAVISFGIQQGMEASIPWSSYFFFPANFGYFLIGVLGYRFYRTDLFRRYATKKNVNIIFFAVLANLILRQYIPYYRNYPWQMYLMFSLSLPFLFQASKNSLWDRWIGNLSYPIYIIHAPILIYLEKHFNSKDGLLTLSLTIAISVVVLSFVDQPLDAIRQRRIASLKVSSS
jgi:peptidoglycan/LPS O-acetylase OafA/YrhL